VPDDAVVGKGALHPFEHDPADDCETCFAAYQDICPFLTKLAQRLGKSKHELCIWDPYYCAGKVKAQLRKLGFTNVVNDNEDFYAMTPEEQPPFDVLFFTSPPYSKDHIQKCMEFAVNGCHKAWFILQPQYVHRKAYYSTLVVSNVILFLWCRGASMYIMHITGAEKTTQKLFVGTGRATANVNRVMIVPFSMVFCVCVCVCVYKYVYMTCICHCEHY